MYELMSKCLSNITAVHVLRPKLPFFNARNWLQHKGQKEPVFGADALKADPDNLCPARQRHYKAVSQDSLADDT